MSLTAESFADTGPELSDPFDVVVVGGGAVGCAVAWEAASRGLRIALLERDDFGSATSANSLGIVHGGLRYLQTLNLRRARASSNERTILLRIAPHLVSPLECIVPTLRSLTRGQTAWAVGLTVNQLLSTGHNRKLPATHRLSRAGLISCAELAQRAPGLAMKDVTGAARWFDGCMTSGERLALAFALSARDRGALVLNHVDVEKGLSESGRITGVAARDRLTGESLELTTKIVLDCRGVALSSQPALFGVSCVNPDFVKAVNIVLGDYGLQCAVGAPARDGDGNTIPGRLFFARPIDRATVLGTWYFSQRSANLGIGPGELNRILEVVNRAFPSWEVTSDDVIGSQVGFLPQGITTAAEPLPVNEPMLIRSASRGGPDGLWHIQTEKWTTVRALAARLISLLARVERLSATPSRTSEQPLLGGAPVMLTPKQSELLSTLNARKSSRITSHYGGRAGAVLDYVINDPALAEAVPGTPDLIRAELAYVLDHEQVRTPEDLHRRLNPGPARTLTADALTYLAAFMDARGPSGGVRRQAER